MAGGRPAAAPALLFACQCLLAHTGVDARRRRRVDGRRACANASWSRSEKRSPGEPRAHRQRPPRRGSTRRSASTQAVRSFQPAAPRLLGAVEGPRPRRRRATPPCARRRRARDLAELVVDAVAAVVAHGVLPPTPRRRAAARAGRRATAACRRPTPGGAREERNGSSFGTRDAPRAGRRGRRQREQPPRADAVAAHRLRCSAARCGVVADASSTMTMATGEARRHGVGCCSLSFRPKMAVRTTTSPPRRPPRTARRQSPTARRSRTGHAAAAECRRSSSWASCGAPAKRPGQTPAAREAHRRRVAQRGGQRKHRRWHSTPRRRWLRLRRGSERIACAGLLAPQSRATHRQKPRDVRSRRRTGELPPCRAASRAVGSQQPQRRERDEEQRHRPRSGRGTRTAMALAARTHTSHNSTLSACLSWRRHLSRSSPGAAHATQKCPLMQPRRRGLWRSALRSVGPASSWRARPQRQPHTPGGLVELAFGGGVERRARPLQLPAAASQGARGADVTIGRVATRPQRSWPRRQAAWSRRIEGSGSTMKAVLRW